MLPLKSFLLKVALPLIIFTAGSDRLSKAYVFDYLRSIPHKTIEITSFFNITQIWNFGVSFGLFKADSFKGVLLLLFVASLIVGFLSYMLIKSQTKIEAIGLACIIGGALGNLFDRLYYGAVYDFLDLHLMGIHFWTFNPADAYITIGAILLLSDQFLIAYKRPKSTH
ncbi:MAG: signal peptidase II [Alphaproteobacteria bacterium]|jgi:signal peptidase II